MGYELYLVRPAGSERGGIGREEWNSYARRHPAMCVAGWMDWRGIGREPLYGWPAGEFSEFGETSIAWRDDKVVVARCCGPCRYVGD